GFFYLFQLRDGRSALGLRTPCRRFVVTASCRQPKIKSSELVRVGAAMAAMLLPGEPKAIAAMAAPTDISAGRRSALRPRRAFRRVSSASTRSKALVRLRNGATPRFAPESVHRSRSLNHVGFPDPRGREPAAGVRAARPVGGRRGAARGFGARGRREARRPRRALR